MVMQLVALLQYPGIRLVVAHFESSSEFRGREEMAKRVTVCGMDAAAEPPGMGLRRVTRLAITSRTLGH